MMSSLQPCMVRLKALARVVDGALLVNPMAIDYRDRARTQALCWQRSSVEPSGAGGGSGWGSEAALPPGQSLEVWPYLGRSKPVANESTPPTGP